jgi:hypothetical protein
MANLPDKPGNYLWFITDWGYLAVGAVSVSADNEKHRATLQKRIDEKGAKDVDFCLYQAEGGKWLTMYYEDRDRKPPVNSQGVPIVDGYREYDFWWLVGEPGRIVARSQEANDSVTL